MNAKTILIVDDNDTIFGLFKDFFESRGYSAETAQNGLEGVNKYRALKPDVVLMDLQMPVMNGYESSKGIKDFDPNAKILMLTGYSEDPLAEKSLREGYVNTVIPKPCKLNTLFETVTHTLAA